MSSRRSVLGRLIGAVGALVAALIGGPIAATLIGPAVGRRPRAAWVTFGPVASIPVGVPRFLTAEAQQRDGWYEHSVRRAVWVVRSEGGAPTVFDPRCTHLGCAYRWDQQRRQFACPCHGGTYAITGRVTGGPPPRPLTVLASKIEEGRLYVRFA